MPFNSKAQEQKNYALALGQVIRNAMIELRSMTSCWCAKCTEDKRKIITDAVCDAAQVSVGLTTQSAIDAIRIRMEIKHGNAHR